MNNRFLRIGIVVAIVAVAAAAIFASSEALSFSAPGDSNSLVKRTPADQAQPLDFNAPLWYYGPDFMCLTHGDGGDVECLAPTLTASCLQLPRTLAL